MSIQPATPASRLSVRVFISSTFQDMQPERDELARRVFPELRARCRDRGIDLIEVDLRWGITEEQERRGEVLPDCLRQIDQSRPFFIGLLGERYGSVPSFVDEGLLEAHPWLRYQDGSSLTELEILHGALLNSVAARHAYFYFRSAEYVQGLPEGERSRYLEDDPEGAKRLRDLKQRLRDEGFPVVDGYPDPISLGDHVLADVWAAIESEFPDRRSPGSDVHPVSSNDAIGGTTEGHVERREQSALDEHVQSSAGGLAVVSPAGFGKTFLLTSWAQSFAHTHPDHVMFQHSLGNPAHGADVGSLVQRLLEQLQREVVPELEVPQSQREQRQRIGIALQTAAERAPVVLVIDGLDQFDDEGGAVDLGFLPTALPPRVSVVCSTRPGRALEAVQRREWRTIELEPLSESEREEVVVRYLEHFGKHLSPDRRRRITSHELMSSPLLLRVVLEELRIGAHHDDLYARIEECTRVRDAAELFDVILRHHDERLSETHPGLLARLLSLLWASRSGLQETELLDLLGSSEGPLPRHQWSKVFLAFQESLSLRAGRVRLRHDHLKQAVATRYMPSDEARDEARETLIAYFRDRGPDPRALEELPWQLRAAGKFEELRNLLIQPAVFQQMWRSSRRDLESHWLFVGDHCDAFAALRELLSRSDQEEPSAKLPADYSDIVAQLLLGIGRPHEAAEVFERTRCLLAETVGWDSDRVAGCLCHLANAQFQARQYDAAAMSQRRALAIIHKSHGAEHESAILALSGLGSALGGLNDPSAESVFRRALALSARIHGHEHPLTAILLDNMANALRGSENLGDAISIHREALAISERTFGPDHVETAKCLDNLASHLIEDGEFEEAEQLLRRSLGILGRERGDSHPHAQIALAYLGRALIGRRDYKGAAEVYRRKLQRLKTRQCSEVTKDLEWLKLLATALNESGQIREAALAWQDYLDALEAHSRAPDLGVMNRLARAKHAAGALEHSRRLFEQVLASDVGTKPDGDATRAHALMGLALVERDSGELDAATPHLREALLLLEPSDDASMERAECLNVLTGIELLNGNVEAADEMSQQAVTILTEAFGADSPQTGSLYDLRGRVLLQRGELETAEMMARRAVEILTTEPGEEHPNTLSALHNLGEVCAAQEDYHEAETLLRRVADLRARVLGGGHPNTVNTLLELEAVLRAKGAHEEALAIADQGAAPHGVHNAHGFDLAALSFSRAQSLSETGRHQEAEQMFQVAIGLCRDSADVSPFAESIFTAGLARHLERRQELDRAEQAYRKALKLVEERAGEVPSEVRLNLIQDLARFLGQRGELDETERLLLQAIDIAESVAQPDPLLPAYWKLEYANLLTLKAEHEAAGALYEHCFGEFRDRLGESHEATNKVRQLRDLNRRRREAGAGAVVSSLLDRGEACLQRGDADGAEDPLQRALSIAEQTPGGVGQLMGRILAALGALHSLRSELDEAERLYRRALELRHEEGGEADPNLVISFRNLAGAQAAKGEHEEAVRLFRTAMDAANQLTSLSGEKDIETCAGLARSLVHLGRKEEAAAELVRAVDANKATLTRGEVEAVALYFRFHMLLEEQLTDAVAEPFLERVLELVPRSSSAWPLMGAQASYRLAFIYTRLERHSAAIPHYEGVLEAVELFLRPEHLESDKSLAEDPLLWAAVACCELAQHRDAAAGRWNDALENLELALKLLLRVGRERAALRIELRLQDARREAGLAVDLRRTREAAARLTESGRPEIQSAAILEAMVVWLRHLGKLADAESLARLAVTLSDGSGSEVAAENPS